MSPFSRYLFQIVIEEKKEQKNVFQNQKLTNEKEIEKESDRDIENHIEIVPNVLRIVFINS